LAQAELFTAILGQVLNLPFSTLSGSVEFLSMSSVECRSCGDFAEVVAFSIAGNVIFGPSRVEASSSVWDLKLSILETNQKDASLHSVMLLHGARGLKNGEEIGSCSERPIQLTAVFSAEIREGVVMKFAGAFGFVHSADVAKDHPLRDVFLHKNDCHGFRPEVGLKVRFTLTLDEKRGYPKAVKVASLNERLERDSMAMPSRQARQAREGERARMAGRVLERPLPGQRVPALACVGGLGAPLDVNMLAAAPPSVQKQMLGERLFPAIARLQPELAGKITGLMLELLDNSELLILLESDQELRVKVEEAMRVLMQI